MKKRDLIIIGSLLAVALAGFLLVYLFARQTGEVGYVYISVGDALYEVDRLDEDRLVEIDQGDGKINHIQIKDGVVRMADSTCPDKQCVQQGEMTAENLDTRPLYNYIICLPNQVQIELRLEQAK